MVVLAGYGHGPHIPKQKVGHSIARKGAVEVEGATEVGREQPVHALPAQISAHLDRVPALVDRKIVRNLARLGDMQVGQE